MTFVVLFTRSLLLYFIEIWIGGFVRRAECILLAPGHLKIKAISFFSCLWHHSAFHLFKFKFLSAYWSDSSDFWKKNYDRFTNCLISNHSLFVVINLINRACLWLTKKNYLLVFSVSQNIEINAPYQMCACLCWWRHMCSLRWGSHTQPRMDCLWCLIRGIILHALGSQKISHLQLLTLKLSNGLLTVQKLD